jgi:hypothetical protein
LMEHNHVYVKCKYITKKVNMVNFLQLAVIHKNADIA